jgi:hypothetical protein
MMRHFLAGLGCVAALAGCSILERPPQPSAPQMRVVTAVDF